MCARSGRLASIGLDAGLEASGPHDFTVRESAVRPRAGDRSHAVKSALPSVPAQRCRVHRNPPRVRDYRDTPLEWDETAADTEVIWVSAERDFSSKGLDHPNQWSEAVRRKVLGLVFQPSRSSRWRNTYDATARVSPATPDCSGLLLVSYIVDVRSRLDLR